MNTQERILEGIQANDGKSAIKKMIEEEMIEIQKAFLIKEEHLKDRQNIEKYIKDIWDKPFDVYRQSVHAIGKGFWDRKRYDFVNAVSGLQIKVASMKKRDIKKDEIIKESIKGDNLQKVVSIE